MNPGVLVVDGSNLLWRACYANAGLGYQADHGFQPTGGVYGFFESVLAVLRTLEDEVDVWVAWEGARSRVHRRAVLPTYKRRPPDEKRERLAQLVGVQAKILRECLAHTGFYQVSCAEWEGDDAMATVACRASDGGDDVLVLSGDADLLQILRQRDCRVGEIAQHKPSNAKGDVDPYWNRERFLAEYGFEPHLLVEMKALAGDASDCYAGVPGIGEVWARRIVAQHGHGDAILEAAHEGAVAGSAAKASTILEHEAEFRTCYKVAEINRDARPLKITEGEPDEGELRRIFRGLRFNTLSSPAKIARLL